jgi:hypothetical protein
VVGFALYGSKEIAIEMYAQTFDLLKAKNVKTAIFVESYDGIISALSIGGAKRLSGEWLFVCLFCFLYSNVVLFVVWLRIYCQAPFRCTSIHLL